MPIEVIRRAVIQRPRAEVAAYACDPHNDTVWIKNIKEVEWLTEPPVAAGTRVARVAYFLGKRMAYTYEVEKLVPGERIDMRAIDGPFPMTTSYTFDDAPDGATAMEIHVGGGPGGFFGLAAPLLAAQMRGALDKDLACLKATLES